MRVIHLSTSDIRGGAARGAFWLHRALRDLGIDSMMLVGRKYSLDGNVLAVTGAFAPVSERIRDALDPLPLRKYARTNQSFWTVGWLPRHIERTVSSLEPDVVHLHWTGGGFLPVTTLGALKQPVVWTLRDMWAFTGGCHYSAGCKRYESSCGHCPQLHSTLEDDLSRRIWRRKKRDWGGQDVTLVPISNWLADCVRKSPLLRGRPIEVIPNGIDVGCFHPILRDDACNAWNLPKDRRYILFGALGALMDQERKGYGQFVEATRILARACWTTRAEVLVFGETALEMARDIALPARFVGYISDDYRLAQLYAAADVMVAPSLQEAFGKTVAEAMACGTPVVAFDGTGPSDIITHRENGYLAKPFSADDLARGISWCMATPDRIESLGHAARKRAVKHFDIVVVARRYVDLYKRVATQAP